MPAKIYGDFFSPEEALSYHRLWMFILGSRSTGKSTGISTYTVKKYLDKKFKFMYVRRTKEETQRTCKTFFSNAITILKNVAEYPIEDFKYDSRYYYIKMKGQDWEECGTIVDLNKEYKYKSNNYQDYGTIIYDEFMAPSSREYLGSKANMFEEYERCISLYQTVDRGLGRAARNETEFFFIGNLSSYFNPIFMALGIDNYLRTDTRICAPKGQQWLVQQVVSVKATEQLKESVAYQLSTEQIRNYAYENIAFDNNMEFVEKLNVPMSPICNVVYNTHKMGVYLVKSLGVVYVCDKPNTLSTLALTCKDQDKINYIMALKYRDDERMTMLKQAYFMGNARFATPKCKYDIANYFMLTP